MLKFVPDHHKTKKICKNAVKKLLFVRRYVPDRWVKELQLKSEGSEFKRH